jgi:hypothetical protein
MAIQKVGKDLAMQSQRNGKRNGSCARFQTQLERRKVLWRLETIQMMARKLYK